MQNTKLRQARYAGYCCWRKDKLISNVFQWTPIHGHTNLDQSAKFYIHQLCEDTESRLEDLPRTMANMDGCQESVKEIHAINMTWWYWWVLVLLGGCSCINEWRPPLRKWLNQIYRNVFLSLRVFRLLSSSLLLFPQPQVFVELVNLQGTSNYILYWINRGHLFWFC